MFSGGSKGNIGKKRVKGNTKVGSLGYVDDLGKINRT